MTSRSVFPFIGILGVKRKKEKKKFMQEIIQKIIQKSFKIIQKSRKLNISSRDYRSKIRKKTGVDFYYKCLKEKKKGMYIF